MPGARRPRSTAASAQAPEAPERPPRSPGARVSEQPRNPQRDPRNKPEPEPASGAPVLLEIEGGVATLTLNRPDQMNSLDVATKVALRDGLAQVAEDSDVRCVVLTGSGRAFCVGQDLNEHVDLLAAGDAERLFTTVAEHYNPIVTSILTMAKPVVAALNGV